MHETRSEKKNTDIPEIMIKEKIPFFEITKNFHL